MDEESPVDTSQPPAPADDSGTTQRPDAVSHVVFATQSSVDAHRERQLAPAHRYGVQSMADALGTVT
ncbi:MAG: hypothetical protein ACXWUG_22610, partial [Polyangiales bacterium]